MHFKMQGSRLKILEITKRRLVKWVVWKINRVSEGSPMGDVRSVSSVMRDFSYYLRHDIWVNIYTVDSKWLYSLYWCMNVSSITTNRCHEFAAMTSPVWHLVSRVQALSFIVWPVVLLWLRATWKYFKIISAFVDAAWSNFLSALGNMPETFFKIISEGGHG